MLTNFPGAGLSNGLLIWSDIQSFDSTKTAG